MTIIKTCRRCGVGKEALHFRADPRYRDGLGSWCVECHRENNSIWARRNRDRLTTKAKERRATFPDETRSANLKFKRANKAKLANQHAEWAQKNKGKRRATTSKYKAAKLRATPSWADQQKITQIYQLAVEIERRTGQRMHVDHIVPLQHPLVCGLHCEHNLQILPGHENESKRNKWSPEAAVDEPRLPGLDQPKPTQEAML